MAVGMSSQTFVSDTRDNMRVFYSIISRIQDLKYKDPYTCIAKWSLSQKNDQKENTRCTFICFKQLYCSDPYFLKYFM